MKQSRFTEERIIAILREQEAGSKTGDVCRKHGISSATFYKWKAKYGGLDVSKARRLKVLTDENAKLKKLLAEAIRRHGRVGRQASAITGRREPQTEEAVGGVDAGPGGAEGASDKKCMVRPGVARSFLLLSEAACVNVSGLSRVSCCCSQAMMRCARIVPKKWYEQEGLDFLTGLTMRRSTVPTSVLGPRN